MPAICRQITLFTLKLKLFEFLEANVGTVDYWIIRKSGERIASFWGRRVTKSPEYTIANLPILADP